MKTREEIQIEAQRLEVLGQQYRNEQPALTAGVVLMPRALLQLPDSQTVVRSGESPLAGSVHLVHHHRQIEAAIESREVIYRLVERETETTDAGQIVREGASAIVMVGRSGFELLQAGYEQMEEERLGQLLVPFAEASEDPNRIDPADEHSVAEVEAILEINQLPPPERLRTRADVVEFLEGRLEPNEFIARAIHRQYARHSLVEAQVEQQELKLTIDAA